MIVKAYVGDGAWNMWQADADYLRFLDARQSVEIPADTEHNFSDDVRFPPVENAELHLLYTSEPARGDVPAGLVHARYMRWVEWRSNGARNLLITDGPVFICNDQGQTVEALR